MTVYFDAFAHDYLSDPLPSLVSALEERCDEGDADKMQRLKNAAVAFLIPTLRVGLATFASGATELLAKPIGAALDAASNEVSDALDKYWAQESGRRGAMTEFRKALTDLTSVNSDAGHSGARLVIVVDELDRCRPDYALEILEVIKHFFAIPGVTFILGVNLTALENSVRARYGDGIDASAYLRKFINLSLTLPSELGGFRNEKSTVAVYLDHQMAEMKIHEHISEVLKSHIEVVSRNNPVSIRDVGKILSAISLVSGDVLTDINTRYGRVLVMITLIVSKVIKPERYKKFLDASVTEQDLEEYFDATTERRSAMLNDTRNEKYHEDAAVLFYAWLYLVTGGRRLPEDNDWLAERIPTMFEGLNVDEEYLRAFPKIVHARWLDLFKPT